MKMILKKMDKDNDGRISKPEFLNIFRLFESMGPQNQKPNNNQGGWGGNQGNQGGWGNQNQGGFNQGNQGGWSNQQPPNNFNNQGGNWGQQQGGFGQQQGGFGQNQGPGSGFGYGY